MDKLEADGAGVTFYAKVANAGDYDVTFRYANGDAAEKSLSVYVNGSYIGKTAMPSTGDWDTWADCLMQLPLAAGNNIITLSMRMPAETPAMSTWILALCRSIRK